MRFYLNRAYIDFFGYSAALIFKPCFYLQLYGIYGKLGLNVCIHRVISECVTNADRYYSTITTFLSKAIHFDRSM